MDELITFSKKDTHFIEKTGRFPNDVARQFQFFKTTFPYLQLEKPARIGEGIVHFSDKELVALLENYPRAVEKVKIAKFVPASGAASRMFKDLFDFLESKGEENREKIDDFIQSLLQYAFFSLLIKMMKKDGIDFYKEVEKKNYMPIIRYLISEIGLNYAHLPKALLPFHNYQTYTRTALEEHFVEAAQYAQNENGVCYLHFTVSPAFQSEFEQKVAIIQPIYEEKYDVRYKVSFSVQHPSTDTLAAEMDNRPFYDENHNLLFRPGGHGALLYNLNQLEYDFVYIKNIDNVISEDKLDATITYKKVLCSYAIHLRTRIFDYLQKIEKREVDAQLTEEILFFGRERLNLRHINEQNMEKLLNRPLRVCGMVRNEGEPGGGPYWVKDSRGGDSLQIVESAQVNLQNSEQKLIFDAATHFNPVDLVCSLKDFKGNYFNLTEYRDPNTGFIAVKSYGNRSLKAMELPGLWNGAMANWITIFVEVPLETFNPVKTVYDLKGR